MITQHFCSIFRISSLAWIFFALLCTILVTTGCELEPGFDNQPARQRSNECSPPCTGSNRACFVSDEACDEEPCVGCYEVTCPPENPIQSCSAGAFCNGSICTFDYVCSPSCPSGQHCVAGNCVINYTNTNVCDALYDCRRQCNTADCLDSCEADSSFSCRSCMTEMSECEQREECGFASPTGCCAAKYCDCFPGAPSCGDGPGCADCHARCTANGPLDPDCFTVCASEQPACAACMSAPGATLEQCI